LADSYYTASLNTFLLRQGYGGQVASTALQLAHGIRYYLSLSGKGCCIAHLTRAVSPGFIIKALQANDHFGKREKLIKK